MIVIGLLGTGAQCVGTLEEDGSLSNVFLLMVQPPQPGQQGIACALIPPFQPFDMDKPLKKINSSFIMSTMVASKELADVYMTRASGIVIAKPQEVSRILK